jgi:RNA polymerase sigma-B factor
MNQLPVHAHIVDGATLVVAGGELDLALASRVRSVLRDAIASQPERVVFDLGTVSLIDASVIGVLAGKLPQAEEAGTRLQVVGASGVVLEVLELMDLAKPLGAYEPRESAPPRPDLPCCSGRGSSGEELADHALSNNRSSYATPNKAIAYLLSEAASLDDTDPHRHRLRARAIELALPAAYQIANRYVGRGEPEDDLLQVAALGLVKAVDGYDPERGHAFSDYALPTILGELRRHFRDRGWTIRVPRHLQELVLDARKVSDALTQELRRTPAAEDVAGALDVPLESIRAALSAARAYRPHSLFAQVGEGPSEICDVIGSPDPGFERAENRELIKSVLSGLPVRTRRIVALRFGRDMSQAEIAAEIGISQMHVSRLLKHAYATLRAALVTGERPARRRGAGRRGRPAPRPATRSREERSSMW